MPPLLLDDDEAIAIAVGLRTAAGASVTGIEETAVRALVKLEQVLPAHLRRRVARARLGDVHAPGPRPDGRPAAPDRDRRGCRDSECLRFGYRARDGTDSRREVEPHSLVNRGRRWYLVAWDRRREDWRTFRVDRLASRRRPVCASRRARLPAKDAAAYVEQSITGARRNRFEARVTLHAAAAEIDEPRPALRGQRSSRSTRTRASYRTGDDDLRWLAMRIAMLGRRLRGARAARARRASAGARRTTDARSGQQLARAAASATAVTVGSI